MSGGIDQPSRGVVLDTAHPDFDWSAHESVRDARHKYRGANVIWHEVADSREGWAKAIELYEVLASEKVHKDRTLVLDFSGVREKGAPIRGMQGRPSSGPVPLMNALMKVASIKGSGMQPWLQALYADHYLAECVLVGGARRAARMAVKHWKDPDILEFIQAKRPFEYQGLDPEQVIALRAERRAAGLPALYAFLWSANNSVLVDAEFWRLVHGADGHIRAGAAAGMTDDQRWAWTIFNEAVNAAYADGTGEPGFINVDQLVSNDDGWHEVASGDFAGYDKYQPEDDTKLLLARLAKRARRKPYRMIVNPCVTAETWIMTSDGPRQVHQLIGRPFSALVNGRCYRASGFERTATREALRIVTDRGYSMRLTADHRLQVEIDRRQKLGGGYNVSYSWIKAEAIREGNLLVLHNHRISSITAKDSRDFHAGWLLGEIVGDGCFNPERYRTLVRFWGEERHEMAALAGRSIKLAGLVDFSAPVLFDDVRGEGGTSITISLGGLTRLATGRIEPQTKAVLPALESASADFVAGFLSGWFDTDGTVIGSTAKGRSVRLSSIDGDRLVSAQRMLARLGVMSTIYWNRRAAGHSLLPDGRGGMRLYTTQALHELVIAKDNMVAFAATVGFRKPSKASRLAELLSSNTRGEYQERFTARMTRLEPCGPEDVYDCSVESVHCFDANGFMAHNCTG